MNSRSVPSRSPSGPASWRRRRPGSPSPTATRTTRRHGDEWDETNLVRAARVRSSNTATARSLDSRLRSRRFDRSRRSARLPCRNVCGLWNRRPETRGRDNARSGVRRHADCIDRRPAGAARIVGPRVEEFAARRATGEPLSRIVGRREFWGLSLTISPQVLDPRPETETIVEASLRLRKDRRDTPLHILDLGVGSGALMCALLREFPACARRRCRHFRRRRRCSDGQYRGLRPR